MKLDEWIHKYARAWESADADAAASLFAPTASYHSSVFRQAHVGGDAIRRYWSQQTLTQSKVAVQMGRPVSTDRRTAVEWWTTMTDGAQGEITLPGCLLLRFDPEGLCTDLWEYWHVESGKRRPPSGWGL